MLKHVGAVAMVALVAACAPTRPAAVNPAAAARPTEPATRPAPAIGTVVQPTADGPQVTIKDFAFGPKEIAVPVGGTLTWTNKDAEPHTVLADDKSIASRAIDVGEEFAFEFDAPGTYAYHCALHPYMTATVVVR